MTKREQMAQETRRKLVAAASRIVRKKGLADTTIEEICDASGVAKGTFYVYFKRKEDVLTELNCLAGFQDILSSAQNLEKPFRERLAFFMYEFALYIEQSSLKLCQDWVRNSAAPERGKISAGMEKLRFDRALVADLFKSGIARGEIKADAPVEMLANTLIDILYGEMLCWTTLDGTEGFAKRTKAFCDSFLESIIIPYLNKGQ